MMFWYQNQAAALRSGRYKYLRAGWWYSDPALFDLEADPGEAIDLATTVPTSPSSSTSGSTRSSTEADA